MEALTLINRVQKELRLPLSSGVTDAHAQLILSFINTVQRKLMTEDAVWDQLKQYGTVATADGVETYNVTATDSYEIDTVRHLQIGTSPPIEKKSDAEFRTLKRSYTSEGQPLFWRQYARSGGSTIIIELLPTPDTIYTIDTEILIRPKLLVNASDPTVLDDDSLFLGALALARKEQGEEYQGDLAIFQASFGPEGDNQGDSNWGDVEPA
jgi:hypothetical protein